MGHHRGLQRTSAGRLTLRRDLGLIGLFAGIGVSRGFHSVVGLNPNYRASTALSSTSRHLPVCQPSNGGFVMESRMTKVDGNHLPLVEAYVPLCAQVSTAVCV